MDLVLERALICKRVRIVIHDGLFLGDKAVLDFYLPDVARDPLNFDGSRREQGYSFLESIPPKEMGNDFVEDAPAGDMGGSVSNPFVVDQDCDTSWEEGRLCSNIFCQEDYCNKFRFLVLLGRAR